MLYQQPFDQPLVPNAPYVDGNPNNGTPGSIPRGGSLEFPQREILNALAAASLTPIAGDLTQLAQAMSIGLWLGQMGGTANAITDALPTLALQADGVTAYAIPSLQPGMTFHGIIPATNTGAATLTLTGFGTAPGARPILRKDGSSIQPGDQPAGAAVTWKWDGTGYRIMSMVQSDVLALILANAAPIGRSAVYIGTNVTTQIPFYAPNTSLEVWLMSAGGGAGASADGTSGSISGNMGGGGGGGALAYRRISGLTIGQPILITMGANGVGVTNAAGTAGATSSFGSYLSCTAGTGGSWGTNTVGAGGSPGTATGIVAANGDWTVAGGLGGFSGANGSSVTTSDVYRSYGRGGQAAMFGIVDIPQTGASGRGYGPGGSGASGGSGLKGGDGAPALCLVRW